jgi:hypothetical protein
MLSHIPHRVILMARWVLLSCGCQVSLHGNARAPQWCPDHGPVTSSDNTR